MHDPAIPETTPIILPDIPALALTTKEAAILSTDGEVQLLPHQATHSFIKGQAALVCHAPFTRTKIGLNEFQSFDVLELFAFVHPTRFTSPTPFGLCKALGLAPPQDLEDAAMSLIDIARLLLQDLQDDLWKAKADPIKIANVMGLRGKGWAWTPFVFKAFGENYDPEIAIAGKADLNIWRHLPEWAEDAPSPPAGHEGLGQTEITDRLQFLLGSDAETRKPQQHFAADIAHSFQPIQEENTPNITLAEAGTGVGKTIGYLAPASLWAQKNKGAVWISTYTKNLQRQIDTELNRLYPNPQVKDLHVAIRKGRENYLCLLNLEDLAGGAALSINPNHAIAAGIMARWAAASRDGDLSGSEFPGWLPSLLGFQHTTALSDRRGECIFSACDHYHRCFVERSIRKSRRSEIVVANHALVMIQSALGGEDVPTRLIFDEGHHLFQAADSAFSAHLSARETRDLRRWILGGEGGRKTRARGLQKRIEDLISQDEKATNALQDILKSAHCLPSDGWSKRLNEGAPFGSAESFLALVMKQVHAYTENKNTPYSLEVPLDPQIEGLSERANTLKQDLERLLKPLLFLTGHLQKILAEDDGKLESDTRRRLDAVSKSLERRGILSVKAWVDMLHNLIEEQPPESCVDWLEIERIDGRPIDVGYYRHFIDPMKPFADTLQNHAHGIGITSATLSDTNKSAQDANWDTAFEQTGLNHFQAHIKKSSYLSPFNYAQNSQVIIINDVRRDHIGQIAGAYKTLFEASGGSALGIFTAISRLRSVYDHMAQNLEDIGIPLYAQHVDDIDAGSLIDMFRDDEHSCLLGTDAVRDGVDVPGESLRLLVFDRVPWPRPSILHKARREQFGGRRYDEMITRMKLKQAFGRLIRRSSDYGTFVMMDNMFPSRLHDAFPEDVTIHKVGLAEAKIRIEEFQKNRKTQ